MNKKNIKTNTSSKDNGNIIDATKCTTNEEFVTTIEKNIELRNKAKQNINKAVKETIAEEEVKPTVELPWYKKFMNLLRKTFITTKA